MSRFRHLFLLRTVLIALLAWTGADLLVPELCAAEAPIPGVTADRHATHDVRIAQNPAASAVADDWPAVARATSGDITVAATALSAGPATAAAADAITATALTQQIGLRLRNVPAPAAAAPAPRASSASHAGAPIDSIPASTPTPQDDCFCCSQTVETVTLDLTLGAPSSLPLLAAQAPRFSPGVPRELFRPPLSL